MQYMGEASVLFLFHYMCEIKGDSTDICQFYPVFIKQKRVRFILGYMPWDATHIPVDGAISMHT